MTGSARPAVAVVVKGYPRLSETFVAQEIRGLELRGIAVQIWSLRHPTDRIRHPIHGEIAAPVRYLPEYLYQAPARVLCGAWAARRRPGLRRLLLAFARDLRREPRPGRIRRLGQALVLARELPEDVAHLHVHFLHTPASVTRYAAILTGRRWSFSAHAKDIWTIPDWEKREKLADAAWGVACTAEGAGHLRSLAPDPDRVSLLYHGLELGRFPAPPAARAPRDGSDPADPIRILALGRLVAKKGFDDLLRALAALPGDLHWSLAHLGGGPLLKVLTAEASSLGIGPRVTFLGAQAQPQVVEALRQADLFVVPSKEAGDGDRDGLPNVVMEAASQRLAIAATRFAAIPEFLRDGREAVLVEPGDWPALSNAINGLARDPDRRAAYGAAAYARLVAEFTSRAGLDWLARRLAGAEGAASAGVPPRHTRAETEPA